MKYKAIMFDMDGTLLPMDMKEFTNGYFALLAQYLRERGFNYDTKFFASAVWAGTADMVKNDGSKPNIDVFWDSFAKIVKNYDPAIKNFCDEFYSADFNNAKKFTSPNPNAVKAVNAARKQAEYVILATNPLFPMVGQETRASWVGLKLSDFNLVTSYENSRFCKPNPNYFSDILAQFDCNATDCLMIGNDEREDMFCASSIGMDCWLAEDCRIPCTEHPWNGVRDTFEKLTSKLMQL